MAEEAQLTAAMTKDADAAQKEKAWGCANACRSRCTAMVQCTQPYRALPRKGIDHYAINGTHVFLLRQGNCLNIR